MHLDFYEKSYKSLIGYSIFRKENWFFCLICLINTWYFCLFRVNSGDRVLIKTSIKIEKVSLSKVEYNNKKKKRFSIQKTTV